MTNAKDKHPIVVPEPAQASTASDDRGFGWDQLKALYASGKAAPAGTTVVTAQAKP
ncbi:hypothetical protein [Pseudomonas putida]|uniref:hypothetical protein n=1 Tax=Pseudomonas putida TaxID=303 RepID=UPI002B24FD44|nr:hypothetical protein [Pseudomonas putida]